MYDAAKILMRVQLFRLALVACLFFVGPAIMGQAASAQIADPTDIPGLRLWVDANDVNGNGVQPAEGVSITTWVDKSGRGNNLSSTGTVQPTYMNTGIDATYPSVRMPINSTFFAANPFGVTNLNDVTVIFVVQQVTGQGNFAVSLNGTNTSSYSGTTGRFSFHVNWSGGWTTYFDAGGTFSGQRLYGTSPTAFYTTSVVTGINSTTNARQELWGDNTMIASDNNAIAPNVGGGVNIGSMPSQAFNGHFGEIVIFDRVLTATEMSAIKCYLYLKRKPSMATSLDCNKPAVNISRSTELAQDNSGPGFFVPDNDAITTLNISRGKGSPLSGNSLFLVEEVAGDLAFYNGDFDGTGPETGSIGFSSTSPGLTWTPSTDVAFSSSTTKPTQFSECTYTPQSGYDNNVRYICLNPKGQFGSDWKAGEMTIKFRVKIR